MSTEGAVNILYVGTLPPHPGGSAILSLSLLKGLAGLGHSVRAIHPITKDHPLPNEAHSKNKESIVYHRYTVEFFETSPDSPVPDEYRRQEGKRLRSIMEDLIREDRPDVLIIGRESFSWYVADTAIKHSIPTLMLIQGGTINGMIRRSLPAQVIETFFNQFKKITHIVSVAEHFKSNFPDLQIEKFSIVPNAVDVQNFFPLPKDDELMNFLKIDRSKIVAAHFSNLKPIKRPFDIVQSASICLKREPRLVYLVVGDGPLRSEMEKECRRFKIQDRFRFVGWVDHRQMPRYYSIADFVLMPSEAEGLALVYLETQASARLLLASDIAAAREVIIDGKTGFLFQKENIADLAEKTLIATSDKDKRLRIGRQARRDIVSYTLRDMVKKYENIILEIASKKLDR